MTKETLEPTLEMAQSLQEITNYLDAYLFNGELPPCYITLTRNNKVIGGYHATDQWENEHGDNVPEIGINSNLLAEPDPLVLYNVLIHELIHLELSHKGQSGRVGYHNQAFAQRCDEIGLDIQVHDKGAKDGQRTGQAVSTSLKPNGKAEKAIASIPTDLAYTAKHVLDIDDNGNPEQGSKPKIIPAPAPAPEKKSAGTRTKYQCPQCGLAMWGKAGASVLCGQDMQTMIES